MCIPLLAGIVGVFQSKYLPTGDMTVGDLRLELTLANATDGVVVAGVVLLYNISDVEMMLEYTDLASHAARMFSQSKSYGCMIYFDSFASMASSIESGTHNCNIFIPARYSSLTTNFTIMRLKENIGLNAHIKNTITNRMNPFRDGGQWDYSIGEN